MRLYHKQKRQWIDGKLKRTRVRRKLNLQCLDHTLQAYYQQGTKLLITLKTASKYALLLLEDNFPSQISMLGSVDEIYEKYLKSEELISIHSLGHLTFIYRERSKQKKISIKIPKIDEGDLDVLIYQFLSFPEQMGNDRKVKKYYFSKFEEYSRLEAILNEEKLLLKYMIKKSILSIVSKAYLLEFDPEKLEAIDYYCPLNLQELFIELTKNNPRIQKLYDDKEILFWDEDFVNFTKLSLKFQATQNKKVYTSLKINSNTKYSDYFKQVADQTVSFINAQEEMACLSPWTHLRFMNQIKQNKKYGIKVRIKRTPNYVLEHLKFYENIIQKNEICFGIIFQNESLTKRSYLSSENAIYLNLHTLQICQGYLVKIKAQELDKVVSPNDSIMIQVNFLHSSLEWFFNGKSIGQIYHEKVSKRQNFVPFIEVREVGFTFDWYVNKVAQK